MAIISHFYFYMRYNVSIRYLEDTNMKAIVLTAYGKPSNLKIIDTKRPTYNKNQILVKMKAANVSSADMRIHTQDVPKILKFIMSIIFGFKKPRRPIRGISGSGIIEEVGSKVTNYKKGDRIYFINSMKAGSYAEYIVLNKKAIIAKIPESFAFEEAAPLAFGALSAYHFINAKNIKAGDDVLIYGASGSVGTYACQLAKYYGANVTAVSSEKNHQVLYDLNVDHCIDYHKQDFRKLDQTYDVIFDAVMKLTKKSCMKVLKPNSKYLSVKTPTKESIERLKEINKIIDQKQLKTVIDQIYPFEKFIEAHKKTYTKHKLGNVIITIEK